jgi:DNA repair photolyase
MDLRRRLMDLLLPLKPGDAILPGVRLAGSSTELGMRLRFETSEGAGLVWVEVSPLDRAPRYAARSERLAFSYRTEGGRSAVVSGVELCRAVAELARSNEARVLSAVEEERPAPGDDGTRVRSVEVEALLEQSGTRDATFYTLSPYVGCLIGCRFCYAQSKVDPMRAVLGLREAPWGSYVDVRRNAPEVLAAELARLPPRPIKFCPIVSDPYHAIEKRERLTRRCLEAIRDAKATWPTLLLTRSTGILADLDVLGTLPLVYAGVSLPTVDDEVRRHFEPRAASVPERLQVLRALRAARVRTLAMVQPLLAGSVEALADALAGAADSVSIDVLRGEIGASEDFADPRYAETREENWQRERTLELSARLEERGIPVWTSELPPDLMGWQPTA